MWWGCRDVVPVGRRRNRVALAGNWVGHGWHWRWNCCDCDGVENLQKVGCGGRRKCGGGIDNGSKRRIVLLASGPVISSEGRDIQADFLLGHSSLEAVSGDRPWSLERFEL